MKYRHRASGALVEVRDDKRMDPQVWEQLKPAQKPAPRKKTTKPDDD